MRILTQGQILFVSIPKKEASLPISLNEGGVVPVPDGPYSHFY